MDPELSPDGLLKFSHKKTAKICDFFNVLAERETALIAFYEAF